MAISTDSIIKLPTPQKLGILFLISALILGAYWYAFYLPQVRVIESKKSKLNDLIRERNVKSNIVKDLDKFKEELGRMNEDLKEVLTKLPDKKEIPNLLKNISNMGKEAGLEVLLFKPQGEQPGQFYAKVPVELKFVGSYHRIGIFFYHVGTLSRIVSIEKFAIEKAPAKKKGETLLHTSCTATTYRYVEKAAAAGAKKKGRSKK
ncbi:MAG: type 4a pilus biogenesis protein PilO [Deltaproteobacteria bacterium]|nr:type 4a pilus biogenesis protein PilO [Deltaproteobacteria bacterium]